MARQARDGFAPVAKEAVDHSDLLGRVIAHLRVAHKLKLGIVQTEFVHDIDRMAQIAADPVANNP